MHFGYSIIYVANVPETPAFYDKAVSAGAVAVTAPQTKPWGQIVAYLLTILDALSKFARRSGMTDGVSSVHFAQYRQQIWYGW